MAAKVYTWNVEVEGTIYQVELEKNKVRINGNEQKLTGYERKLNFPVTEYKIPLASKSATLVIGGASRPTLVLDGRDCFTGEVYEEQGMPRWGYIFFVLYCINWGLLIGGAIGGAINGGFIYLSANIASNYKKKTVRRVLACVGLWIASVILELFLAILITAIL